MSEENGTTPPQPMQLGATVKPIIKMTNTGSVDYDLFMQASGGMAGQPPTEQTSPERKSVDVKTTPTPKEEPEDEHEEAEETDEQEESDESDEQADEQTAEAPKGKPKKYKAKDAEGNELELTGDVVFTKKVDGEVQEITLEEALSTVAGERTVQARLGEIGQFKHELTEARDRVNAKEAKVLEVYKGLQEMAELADSGKPEQLLARLAELRGVSPAQYWRSFTTQVQKWAKALEGKSPEQMDAWFNKVEADSLKKRLAAQEEAKKQSSSESEFLSYANQLTKENQISKDEFVHATRLLTKEGDIEGKSREEVLELVVGLASHMKHLNMVSEALDRIDPKLKNNSKLVEQVLRNTDHLSFTVDDLVIVIQDVVGEKTKKLSQDLSRKAQRGNPSLAKPNAGKSNDKAKGQVFKSGNDLARALLP